MLVVGPYCCLCRALTFVRKAFASGDSYEVRQFVSSQASTWSHFVVCVKCFAPGSSLVVRKYSAGRGLPAYIVDTGVGGVSGVSGVAVQFVKLENAPKGCDSLKASVGRTDQIYHHLDHLDPNQPFCDVVQDLYSTDPTQETRPR